MAVEVDASLKVKEGTSVYDLEVASDTSSPTTRSLPVSDAAARSTLADLLSQLTIAVAKLQDIDSSNASISLSVDTVESLLQQIKDNALSEDFAQESTLTALLTTLQQVRDNATAEDFAQEATLQAVLTELQQKLEAFPEDFPDATAQAHLVEVRDRLPRVTGTWSYSAGVAGAVTLTGGKRVIGIAAHATTAGSFTINGGDSIPIPANSSIEIQPVGNLTDPTIVFTGTDSYFVESVA